MMPANAGTGIIKGNLLTLAIMFIILMLKHCVARWQRREVFFLYVNTWQVLSPISKKHTFASLKFITSILAACVLCCSVIPCCVDDNCADEITAGAQPHQQDDDCKGNCSPFFACGSCTGFSVNVQSLEISPVPLTGHPVYATFYICPQSEYFPTFWQPPKLSWK